MVDKELDLYVNSGVSTVFRNAETGAIVGGQLFCSWSKNDDYEVIEDASMASWHNLAAEVAMEISPERPQVRNLPGFLTSVCSQETLQAIWRDFQYQHLYNLAQKRIRDTGATFCAYIRLGYLSAEARGKAVYEVGWTASRLLDLTQTFIQLLPAAKPLLPLACN